MRKYRKADFASTGLQRYSREIEDASDFREYGVTFDMGEFSLSIDQFSPNADGIDMLALARCTRTSSMGMSPS